MRRIWGILFAFLIILSLPACKSERTETTDTFTEEASCASAETTEQAQDPEDMTVIAGSEVSTEPAPEDHTNAVSAMEAVSVPFTTSGAMSRYHVEISEITVRAVSEDTLAYTVTAKTDGTGNWTAINGFYSSGEPFSFDMAGNSWDSLLMDKAWNHFTFYLDRESVMNSETLTFCFCYNIQAAGGPESKEKFYAQTLLSDYEVPEYVSVAVDGVTEPDIKVQETWYEEKYFEVNHCTFQILSNDYVRCVVEYTKTPLESVPEYITELATLNWWENTEDTKDNHYFVNKAEKISQQAGKIEWYIPMESMQNALGFDIHIMCYGGEYDLYIDKDAVDISAFLDATHETTDNDAESNNQE